MAKTGEELGYEDARRQVLRSLQRRLKSLQDAQKDAPEDKRTELRARISEVEHLLNVVESLQR